MHFIPGGRGEVTLFPRDGGIPGGVVVMPPGSPNPDPISDQIMQFSYPFLDLAPVVNELDSAIHQINHYPVDKY